MKKKKVNPHKRPVRNADRNTILEGVTSRITECCWAAFLGSICSRRMALRAISLSIEFESKTWHNIKNKYLCLMRFLLKEPLSFYLLSKRKISGYSLRSTKFCSMPFSEYLHRAATPNTETIPKIFSFCSTVPSCGMIFSLSAYNRNNPNLEL